MKRKRHACIVLLGHVFLFLSIFAPFSIAVAQETTCLGLPATIVGTEGNDVLKGTRKGDVISGLDGNDLIRGGGGNDTICGGAGADTLNGDDGNDILNGEADNDTLRGGDGKDTLDGNEGNDILSGQAGDDILKGGDSRDTLSGGGGNDILSGQDADDTLRGGAGEDTLNGGGGNDILDGQADNDTCLNGEQNSSCETTCTETTAEEFEPQAFGAWADTLNHARSLGYANTEVAQSCIEVSTGETKHVSATLVNPTGSPPDDRVFLASSTPYHLAFLVKVDANGIPTVFNQNGGVRMPPDGPGEVVGADGTPLTNASTSQVMSAAANNCPSWLDYLFCLADENALTIFQTAACFIAIDLDLVLTGATLGTAAAFLTPATIAICADIIAGPIPPGAEGSNCDVPNDDVCDSGSVCSEVDTCQWGFCVPAIPANIGEDCSGEKAGFPRCTTANNEFETLVCNPLGYCSGPRLNLCAAGEICTGDPGNASCQNECDDGISCTQDVFIAGVGCTHTLQPAGTPCDDGIACTGPDECGDPSGNCGGNFNHLFCSSNRGFSSTNDPDADCVYYYCSPGLPGADADGCVPAGESAFSPCDDGNQCTDFTNCLPGAVGGSGDKCVPLGGVGPEVVCCGGPIPACS